MHSRYIKILAIRDGDTYKPFWEIVVKEQVKYEQLQTLFYPDKENYKDVEAHEVYWDMVDGKVISGVVIEVKPDISKLKHKVGDVVYRKNSYLNSQALVKDMITDIQYLEYDSIIRKVRDLRDADIQKLTEDQKKLISVTGIIDYWYWKPAYVMASGFNTTYEHEIFTIAG